MSSFGPNSAGAGADNAAHGTITWSNPGNVTASDDSRAVANLTASTVSHDLDVSTFGFSLPSGTINGIVVEVERSAASADTVKWNRVVLLKAGAEHGGDKSSATYWPTSDAYESFGGAADVWSGTWTPTDINASTFGIRLRSSTIASGGSGNANIDHVRITIYYTEVVSATITGVTATANAAGQVGSVAAQVTKAVTGVTTSSTAAGIAGSVAAQVQTAVTGVTATATASGIAGVVTTVRYAAITGVTAAATAAGIAGVVAAVRIVSVVGATASAIASGIAGFIQAVMTTGGSAGPSVAGTLDTGGSAGPSIAASDTGGTSGPTATPDLDTGGTYTAP